MAWGSAVHHLNDAGAGSSRNHRPGEPADLLAPHGAALSICLLRGLYGAVCPYLACVGAGHAIGSVTMLRF